MTSLTSMYPPAGGHIAAGDLAVQIDVIDSTVQAMVRTGDDLLEGDIGIPGRESRFLARLSRRHDFAVRMIGKNVCRPDTLEVASTAHLEISSSTMEAWMPWAAYSSTWACSSASSLAFWPSSQL